MISKPKCIKNKFVEYLCSNQKCQLNPYLCSTNSTFNSKCECEILHDNNNCMIFVKWDKFFEKIHNSKSDMTCQEKNNLNHIEQMLEKLLVRVKKEINLFQQFKKYKGYQAEIQKFIEYYEKRQYQKITPHLINTILTKPKKNSIKSENNQQNVSSIAIQVLECDNQADLLLSKIKKLYQSNQETLSQSLFINFSMSLKSESILVQKNVCRQMMTFTNYANSIILIQPKISQFNNKFRFKVIQKKYTIGFGICVKSQIVNNNYCLPHNLNDLVVVLSSGRVPIQNQTKKKTQKRNKFIFEKNDFVQITIDFRSQKVNFIRNGQQLRYSQLSFPFKRYENEELYGFALLAGKDDCVELITQNQKYTVNMMLRKWIKQQSFEQI